MKFTVKKAEAIYTGGGIFVYDGTTEEGLHFIASDDPVNFVLITESKTMTTELTDDEWNDMWYCEWQDAHKVYETETEAEANDWMSRIYRAIIADEEQAYIHSDMKARLAEISRGN